MGSRARATGDDKPSVRVMGRGMRPLSYLQTPANNNEAEKDLLEFANKVDFSQWVKEKIREEVQK